jgi:ribosome-binding protein aMBF1 (putative translation factor)
MFQDWTPVGWNKQGTKQTNETKKDFLKRESQAGRVISSMNNTTCNKAGSNGLNDKVMSARKLDEEEDTFKHKSVSLSISKRIAQKRCEMKLTQKELAMKLSLPESIIKDYEKPDGKVIPNPNILNKIEKILGRVRD